MLETIWDRWQIQLQSLQVFCLDIILLNRNSRDRNAQNMVQRLLIPYPHILQKNTEEDFPEVMLQE